MTIRPTALSSVVCLLLGLSAAGCGSGGDNGATGTGGSTGSGGTGGGGSTGATLTAAQFGDKYKFSATDLAGWTPADPATDSTAYNVYNGGDELVGRLDGGDIYTSKGCRVSMYQDLIGPDPEICTLVAMDFVTDAQATGMFTFQEGPSGEAPAAVSIPGYAASDAIGSSFALGGQNMFAHFKASYFELQFSGFTDATSAGAAAKQFLDVLKAKTN
jgi:hypothetical protein